MGKMKKCKGCGIYTMKEECPKCGGRTETAHPPKFSPDDKYAAYRRKARFGDGI